MDRAHTRTALAGSAWLLASLVVLAIASGAMLGISPGEGA
jgi:hypothetical protein